MSYNVFHAHSIIHYELLFKHGKFIGIFRLE